MTKILKAVKKAAARAVKAGVDLYKAYPARANSYIATCVVALAGVVGVGLNLDSVAGVAALVVPILIGEATHHRVRPVR